MALVVLLGGSRWSTWFQVVIVVVLHGCGCGLGWLMVVLGNFTRF